MTDNGLQRAARGISRCRPVTYANQRIPNVPNQFVPSHPISVIAHNIRSAHNVGSIFRTADSAGLSHVYLTGFSATPEHRGVRKTALGAENAVSWSHHPDPLDLINRLKDDGIRIAALERTDSAIGVDDVCVEHFPMALIVGNEVNGIDPALIKVAEVVLALPQYGIKDSLNVSVAFGIAVYRLVEGYRAG